MTFILQLISWPGEALNIPNLLYIDKNFNIRDIEWDPSVLLYPVAGQSLRNLADFYSPVHSIPVLAVPTYYSDISGYANSVIDLIFLGISCAQVVHCIEPDLRWPSDYAPLIVNLSIASENIQMHRKVLKQDSDEKAAFLLFISEGLSQLDFSALDSVTGLDILWGNLWTLCWLLGYLCQENYCDLSL